MLEITPKFRVLLAILAHNSKRRRELEDSHDWAFVKWSKEKNIYTGVSISNSILLGNK